MLRSLCLVSICALLAGCGGGGGSGWNPLGWFGGGGQRGPQTLEPKGGYARTDQRLAVPQVLSARWEPTVEGRLLVVTAIAPTKGWWDVALVTETPQPEGRVRPDADGVLRLRLIGSPPLTDDRSARLPAQPGPDTITVAFPISAAALERIDSVAVSAGNNGIALKV